MILMRCTEKADIKKFVAEIGTFEATLAPKSEQKKYYYDCLEKTKVMLMEEAQKHGTTYERCLLSSICGELPKNATGQQQAEFASRLILVHILTETVGNTD